MMYSAEELHALAKVLAGTGIYILSDELYEKIVFDGNKHVSIGSFDEVRDQTITVNGASKIFAMTGWRIGFLTGPHDIIHAASIVQSQSTTNATSFAQKGVLAALQSGQADVDRMVKAYQERRDVIVELLSDIPGTSFLVPHGTFYVWMNVAGCFSDMVPDVPTLAHRLLENNRVGVMPGSAFGDGNHIRISFSCSLSDIKEGVARLRAGLLATLPAVVE
jgi:aspartate aminotransferase